MDWADMRQRGNIHPPSYRRRLHGNFHERFMRNSGAIAMCGKSKACMIIRQMTGGAMIEKKRDFVSQAWRMFAGKLSTVLSTMSDDQMLEITDKRSNRRMRFTARGVSGMRVEIVDSDCPSRTGRLTRGQIAQLVMSGWGTSAAERGESAAETGTERSSDFFVDFSSPVSPSGVASRAVEALSEIIGIARPEHLGYRALDASGRSLTFTRLGIESLQPEKPEDPEKPRNHVKPGEKTAPDAIRRRRLLNVVRKITKLDNLAYDNDGDIILSYGTISLCIGIIDDPPFIRFYAPVLEHIRETRKLYARLNELNASIGCMHLFARNRRVYAISDITAVPFNAAIIETSMNLFAAISQDISRKLQIEFTVNPLIPAPAQSAMVH
jgi:hypothetical protein